MTFYCAILSATALSTILLQLGFASKYNQRIFEDIQAINFPDPLKNGFRVILSDEFVRKNLRPTSLPTLFVSAVPLNSEDPRYTKVMYPEAVTEDKLVRIDGLKERSWYYVCIEWENINRHNETTGTSCQLYRTLDRFGKTQTTAVTDAQIVYIGDNSLRVKAGFDADFPIRITAYLDGGEKMAPALTFLVQKQTTLDLFFPYLEPDVDYGKLCILEEPMVSRYSAMGRVIGGITKLKCHFKSVKTNGFQDKPMAMEPEKAAYRRLADSKTGGAQTLSLNGLNLLAVLCLLSV